MFSDGQLQTVLFLCKEHLAVRSFITNLNPQFEPAVELEASVGSLLALAVAELQARQADVTKARAAKLVEDQKALAPANGETVKTS